MSKDILNTSLVLIALLVSITISPLPLAAACVDGKCDSPNEYTDYINQLNSTLTKLSQAKDTLSNQVNILNSQITLTLLKITQTESTIKILESEIGDLGIKIDKLDVNLNQLSGVFLNQVTQNYKLQKRTPPVFSLLAGNFNSFYQQYKYLEVLQQNNHNLLLSMETTRTNYDIQKDIKTKKQQELAQLEKALADQKLNLLGQKESKSHLLAVTKNDEQRYQKLKQAAEEELKALLNAKLERVYEVKKGDTIGLMGNTGYSFGDHLHFGLYNLTQSQRSEWVYTSDTDPSAYLRQHLWPMNDPIEITQGRGATKYSYLYKDRFHHGLDMVSTNKIVRAVNDGTAYVFRNTSSSLGNHIKLFHPDGKMTLYLHLQ